LGRPKPPKGRTKEEQRAERSLVGLDKETAESVQAAAAAVGGGPAAQSRLLAKLQEARGGEARAEDLKAVLADMAQKEPRQGGGERQKEDLKAMLGSMEKEDPAKAKEARQSSMRSSPLRHAMPTTSVSIFGAKPLGIFPKTPVAQSSPPPGTLERCQERALQQAFLRAPSNWFEEMAVWTEQGKVWPFPVDNELGMEDEASIGFHEHVFVLRHLEPWCPKVGPIRHHMELVCHGLSINPYMTARRKRDIIEWHRDFFEEHRATLESVGAYPKKAEAQS